MSAQSSAQEALLGGLGIGDLVDQESNTALGNDVRGAIANLNGHDRVCCCDAVHWEQVNHWVGAPADHGHNLGGADLAPDCWVSLVVGGSGKTNNELTVVAGDNHEGRAKSKCPGLAVVRLLVQIHHQEDLNEQQRHSQEPVHVSVGIVERHTCQSWCLHLHGTINHGVDAIRVGPH